MDRKTKIFFLILFAITIVSLVFLYDRIYIQRNYELTDSEEELI